MQTTVDTAQIGEEAAFGQQDAFPCQEAEDLVQQHDQLLAKLVDDAQNDPLTHINPYVLLELIREQSAWLHVLEQRVRALESPD